MKHLVLGCGNLGLDLVDRLGPDAQTLVGWRYPESSMDAVIAGDWDVVWCCIGAGSVEHSLAHFDEHVRAHVLLPQLLMTKLAPETRLVLFSTDYVAHTKATYTPEMQLRNPRSFYAYTKAWMEQLALMGFPQYCHPNVRVVRVGSLYGERLPHKTFPGKLRSNYPKPARLALPENRVSPTPTRWLADFLVTHLDDLFDKPYPIAHCAPVGNVSLREWGERILGPEYVVTSRGMDGMRPHTSDLRCNFAPAPTVEELLEQFTPFWRTYEPKNAAHS
jgi:dTDP-4-dehydrorhamnose reductase